MVSLSLMFVKHEADRNVVVLYAIPMRQGLLNTVDSDNAELSQRQIARSDMRIKAILPVAVFVKRTE